MNKELQKLLKQINDKKNEVKSLVNDGKLDKAKKKGGILKMTGRTQQKSSILLRQCRTRRKKNSTKRCSV